MTKADVQKSVTDELPTSTAPIVDRLAPAQSGLQFGEAGIKVSSLQTYRRLLRYVKPFWFGWMVALCGFAVAAVSQLAWAELLEWLLEVVDKKAYDQRWLIGASILAIFVVRGVSTFLANYAMTYVSAQVVLKLRQQLFARLLHLPYRFHQQNSAGRILSLVSYNTEQLNGATTDAVRTLLQEGLLAMALLGYLLYVNWQLSLLFLVASPIIAGLMRFAARRLKVISERIQNAMGDVAQVTTDAVKGYQIVKSYQGEPREQARFTQAAQNNFRQTMKLAVTSGVATPVIQTIVGVQMTILILLALTPGFLAEVGAPQFMAYITAAGLLVKPAKSLSGLGAVLMRGVAAAEQIFKVLDLSPEYLGEDTNTRQKLVLDDASVEFTQVQFAYESALPNVLNNLSLKVASGETIALVGRTGSGKTTLTDLLLGFYRPTVGDIRVGGQSLSAMALTQLRENIALIPQYSEIFQGTVRDNIAYGALSDASDADIMRAATMAHAVEFIDRLPLGLDTVLGEQGVRLSGGQRQRLAIARAILKGAPILVMDEATSALDNESERLIQAAMAELRGKVTMIVVAHRLSTVEQVDRIFVLDKGEIIETGSHAALLKQQGLYAKLYRSDLEQNA